MGIGTYPLSPFLRGRGNAERVCEGIVRGGLGFYGVIHSLKAIKTAREINHQKAMRAPFPCRHRRSLQGAKRITGTGGIGPARKGEWREGL